MAWRPVASRLSREIHGERPPGLREPPFLKFLVVPKRTWHEVGLVVQPWLEGVILSATFKNVSDLRIEHQQAPAFTGLGRIPPGPHGLRWIPPAGLGVLCQCGLDI